MRAQISSFNRSLNNYQAKTENNIALSFSVLGGGHLRLNELLEVDLLQVIDTQQLTRISDGKVIQIKIGAHDLHDLNVPIAHGTSRSPSKERLAGGA
jgi:hypothetical protein